MISVTLNARDLYREWRSAPREIKKRVGKTLSHWGTQIKKSIRGDRELFTHDTGRLKRSLWTKRRGVCVQELGWGVPYGYVLEDGPKTKRQWVIKPRNAKVLRWRSGGKWVFAKRVLHKWNTSHLRPHFRPWLEHHRRHILQDLQNVLRKELS